MTVAVDTTGALLGKAIISLAGSGSASGATWTQSASDSTVWRSVASSADGTKLIAGANQDRLYTSTDSGATRTGRYYNGNWNGVASSADGTKLVGVASSGKIATSTDSGATWTARMTDQNRNWYDVASSADGTKLVASVYGGQLYTSIDSGVTWTARDSARNWRLVASSAEGSHLIAAERDGPIYVSSNSGENWTTLDSTRDWDGVAISADGARLLASVYGGQLYTLGTASDISQTGPDFVVTTIDDHDDGVAGGGDTSLREAINAANANPNLSIISFDPTVFGTAQIIQLASPLPQLTSDIEIQGTSAGLTVRRAAEAGFSILQVNSSATVVLRDLTITNGAPDYGGGGVQNSGTVTVDHCVISDNVSPRDGGGIENYGILTVIHSTISGNSAPAGGGMRHLGSGLLTITNGTISASSATGATESEGGGAIHLNAGYGGGGTGATLDSVTITANTAPNQSGGGRQGIWLTAGTLEIRNTIVVGNGIQDLQPDGSNLVSHGHNLIGMSNAAISFTQPGPQRRRDPPPSRPTGRSSPERRVRRYRCLRALSRADGDRFGPARQSLRHLRRQPACGQRVHPAGRLADHRHLRADQRRFLRRGRNRHRHHPPWLRHRHLGDRQGAVPRRVVDAASSDLRHRPEQHAAERHSQRARSVHLLAARRRGAGRRFEAPGSLVRPRRLNQLPRSHRLAEPSHQPGNRERRPFRPHADLRRLAPERRRDHAPRRLEHHGHLQRWQHRADQRRHVCRRRDDQRRQLHRFRLRPRWSSPGPSP